MKLLLVCRYGQLFIIYSIFYKYGSLILLAVIRRRIHCLLYCQEVSRPVSGNNKIIIHDMSCKFWNDLDDMRQEQFHNLTGPCSIGVGIVYLSFRMLRIGSLLDPHVIFPGRFITKTDEPLLSNCICIDKRQSIFFSNLLDRIRIVPVTVYLQISLIIKPSA